jgi:hypothetical protein
MMIYNADRLRTWDVDVLINGKYVAARPVSGTFLFERLKAAWLVLTGKCDALKWTNQ